MQKIFHRSIVIPVIIVLIGLAHTAMSPVMYSQAIKVEVMGDKVFGFVYFFALTCIAFFFAGLIRTYAVKRIKNGEYYLYDIPLYLFYYLD